MDGHIKLTDFGLSKMGVMGAKKIFTFCGTPEYLAPEIIKGNGYTKAVDWWSLGLLLYEMLSGRHPFKSGRTNKKTKSQMFKEIQETQVEMLPGFSEEATGLLEGLLEIDPEKRLGYGPDDADEIMGHPFFDSVDWNELEKLERTPPYVPNLLNEEDTSNFQ